MEFGRGLKTPEEKAFWKECYKIGMKKGWCSGKYAEADGDFIVEEDRLNENSVCVIDDIADLKAFFRDGNWCLGQAVIYRSLCFIQQVNGGDEWLTIKKFSDGTVRDFESITFGPSARDYSGDFDYSYLSDDSDRKQAEKKNTEHFKDFFNREIRDLLNAKIYKNKNNPKMLSVIYADWEIEEYKDKKPVAE